MLERSRIRLAFWLVVLFVAYTIIAWSISDYTVCVSSQMVELGQAPVVNAMDCS